MNDVKPTIDLPEGGGFIIDKIEAQDEYYNFILTGTRLTPTGEERPSTIYLRTYEKKFEDITILEHWEDWLVSEEIELGSFMFVPQVYLYLPDGQELNIWSIQKRSGYYNFRLAGFVKPKEYYPNNFNYYQKIEVLVRSAADNVEDFVRCAWIDWEIKETEEIWKNK